MGQARHKDTSKEMKQFKAILDVLSCMKKCILNVQLSFNDSFFLWLILYFVVWQVTIEYKYDKGACVPLRVHSVVISAQHDETVTLEKLRKELMEKVVNFVIPQKYLDSQTKYHIQPSGKFIIGGPQVQLRFYLSKSNCLF